MLEASAAFECFEFAAALQAVENFFWADLCDNYLELVKVRAYSKSGSAANRSALATLKIALSVQLRLFAPFLPFVTEELWSWLFATREGRERSIHAAPWPAIDEFAEVALPKEHDPFGVAISILLAVRRIKSEANVSVKTPLQDLAITGSPNALSSVRAVLDDLLSAINAPSGVLKEGIVERGQFDVQAIVGL